MPTPDETRILDNARILAQLLPQARLVPSLAGEARLNAMKDLAARVRERWSLSDADSQKAAEAIVMIASAPAP